MCFCMCLSGTAKQLSLYNICNFCVCIVYLCTGYVLVYFVLYVYNCMHKRTIKYLVSCILYLDISSSHDFNNISADQQFINHFDHVQ